MVISKNYWSENFKKFADEKHNYTVLDISHIGYAEDRDRLDNSIYVLDYCNMIAWVNDFYNEMNINKRLNEVIMFDVLKSLYTGKAFNDKQLKDYFKLLRDFSELEGQIKKLNSHFEALNIPSEVEFMLLGLSNEDQKELGDTIVSNLNSDYVPVLVQMLTKEVALEDFIKKAKEMIALTAECATT